MILMRLRAWRDAKRRQLSIIPFILTFANACLGLLSVLYALDNQFIAAAYCIIAAALIDGLDGKLARVFGSSSTLGMELDSLCDAISFCFAPAILLYSWNLSSKHWVGLIAVGLYLCAGLFRLAKFNMITSENKQCFIGLPTTAAASWVAGFVIASPWLENSKWQFMLKPNNLVLIIAILALLMISNIHFPLFKSRRGIIPIFLVIPAAIICAGLYALIAHVPFCLMMVSAYIGSSLVLEVLLFLGKCCS